MHCPNCNREVPEGKRFCGYCGYRLTPAGAGTPAPPGFDENAPTRRYPAEAAPPGFDEDAPTRLYSEEPAPPAMPVGIQPQPQPPAPTSPPLPEQPSPAAAPLPSSTRKRGVPGWAWGLGGALALVCLGLVVVVPALGPKAPELPEGAMATARPTSRPADTATPRKPTTPPEKPAPTHTSVPSASYWEAQAETLDLTHGASEIIASGTGDFIVAFDMVLRDEGAGDGQINFNIIKKGGSDEHIVAIELSTGQYALQGGGGPSGWTVSDAIETGPGAYNFVEIWGERDVVTVAVNGEVLAEFDHPTTGVDNLVYLTVYHEVLVSIEGIYAEGID
jgi:hypothetical protein